MTYLDTGCFVKQDVFAEAVKLAEQHTGTIGCRSLDILHCAAAKVLASAQFISTDTRQKKQQRQRAFQRLG